MHLAYSNNVVLQHNGFRELGTACGVFRKRTRPHPASGLRKTWPNAAQVEMFPMCGVSCFCGSGSKTPMTKIYILGASISPKYMSDFGVIWGAPGGWAIGSDQGILGFQ